MKGMIVARWRTWAKTGLIVLAALVVITAIATLAYTAPLKIYPNWFGLWPSTETTTTTKGAEVTTAVKEQSAKTLWDWAQLLLVPLVLAVGGYWLNQRAQ